MREFNKHLFAVTKTHVYEFDQFSSLISTINVDATKGFIIGNDNYLSPTMEYILNDTKNLNLKWIPFVKINLIKSNQEIQHIIGISSNSTTIEKIDLVHENHIKVINI